jgi:copper(I)-binding protein
MKRFLPSLLLLTLSSPAFACGVVAAGDIAVENAWSRATISADRPGAVYLVVHNSGAKDDVLTGIATPMADMPMLHETVVKDGVASMTHVMAVPVAAGQTVTLAPGGLHAMLMGMTQPLEQGATFPLTLTFESAGEITVSVDVLGAGAEGQDCQVTQP